LDKFKTTVPRDFYGASLAELEMKYDFARHAQGIIFIYARHFSALAVKVIISGTEDYVQKMPMMQLLKQFASVLL